MHEEVALVEELQASRKVAACPTNPFSHTVELAVLYREERYDAIGFAELPSP